jgi:Protein of unknown function (DUF1687)
MRVLTLLKQAHATATTTATEDQASAHNHHSDAQNQEFELDVTDSPPTSDQLRTILEYVGEKNAGQVVEGASGAADAQRRVRGDDGSFKRPVVSHLSLYKSAMKLKILC